MQRPQFSDIVDKFDEGKIGSCKKDQNWLYVEFYGDDKRFAEAKALLNNMLIGQHELDKDKFYELIKSAIANKSTEGTCKD